MILLSLSQPMPQEFCGNRYQGKDNDHKNNYAKIALDKGYVAEEISPEQEERDPGNAPYYIV